jgi:hypothetical protein
MTLRHTLRHSRAARAAAAGLSLLAAALGCTSARPVLYENETLKEKGRAAAAAAIEQCIAEARAYASSDAAQVVRQTATSGAVGAATGVVIGAIVGRPGTGAAVGAAGAATTALVGGIIGSFDLDPIERNYVDRCLRERGYDPMGWR